MGWDHGYFSQETYTAHFHSEMAPNWLDFAALQADPSPLGYSHGEGSIHPRRGRPLHLHLGGGVGAAGDASRGSHALLRNC